MQDTEEKIIAVDPSQCCRWKYADRSDFEFVKIHELAEDIIKNGQINPVIIRESEDGEYKYEIIAGSRRWKACLSQNIPLKAILTNYDDKQAAIAQIRENEQHDLSSYSRGMFYSKLLKSKTINQQQLADNLGIGRSTVQNLICFAQIPEEIMEAISVPDKISGRSAYKIYMLSKKGQNYIDALLSISEEIRGGLASDDIEHRVKSIVRNNGHEYKPREEIKNKKGQVVARWYGDRITIKARNSTDRHRINKLLEIIMGE